MTLSLRYAAVSDVGRVRKDNQDSGFAGDHLLVVADGVGGAARGDLASSVAVSQLRRLDEPPGDDLLEALAGAIHRAHDRIAEMVEEDRELEGTSTTLTAVLFDGARLGVGHVGDSRAYLLRGGEISQITKDHTFVQTLVDEGRITDEESRSHPHRNLILRAVDGVHETEPDLFYVDVEAGDRLLLCSDGASGVLDAPRIAQLLGDGTVDLAAVELVRAALDAGSSDNVTCIVADVVEAAGDAAAAEGSADADTGTLAAATTGPMLVGAAAEQPRRPRRGFGRRSDTGELDPGEVASGGPAGADVDPEELRYAPRPPKRLARLRWFAVLAVVLALVAAGGAGAYAWTQRQYYVSDSGEHVAIWRGVQADVPGVTLTSVYDDSGVALSDLPAFTARQVRQSIDAGDLAHARSIVARLDRIATACQEARAQAQRQQRAQARAEARQQAEAQASASARASRGASPTGSTGSTAPPSPSTSATPSPSPAESSPTSSSTGGSGSGRTGGGNPDCTGGGL